MRARVLSCLLGLIVVAIASPCSAAELFGQATTEFAWWQDLVDRDTKFSAYQYLRVGALDLVKERDISLFGYGRFGYNEVADDEDEDADGRLYYLYMDWRDVWKDRIDLRLGRTWTNIGAASSIIDGAQVDFKNLGPVGVMLLGGRDVIFDEFDELTQSGDIAWGGQVYLTSVKNLDLNISYAEKYDEDDLARRTVAYDVGYNIKEISRVYSDGRFDLISEELSELVAGIKVFPNDTWTIRGEYFTFYPTFDATSIYVVFAASRFQSGSLYVDYYVSDNLTFYGGFSGEYFDLDDADDDDAYLFEIGTNFRVKDIRFNGSILVREGFPGDLVGFSLAADRPFLNNKLDLAAGIDYDFYKRESMTDDEIATKYWLAARYYFTKKVSLALHVENTESATQDHNFAGWSTLEIAF